MTLLNFVTANFRHLVCGTIAIDTDDATRPSASAVEACYYDLTREKKDTIIFGLHANKLDTKAIVVGQSIPSLPSCACLTPYRRSKLK